MFPSSPFGPALTFLTADSGEVPGWGSTRGQIPKAARVCGEGGLCRTTASGASADCRHSCGAGARDLLPAEGWCLTSDVFIELSKWGLLCLQAASASPGPGAHTLLRGSVRSLGCLGKRRGKNLVGNGRLPCSYVSLVLLGGHGRRSASRLLAHSQHGACRNVFPLTSSCH